MKRLGVAITLGILILATILSPTSGVLGHVVPEKEIPSSHYEDNWDDCEIRVSKGEKVRIKVNSSEPIFALIFGIESNSTFNVDEPSKSDGIMLMENDYYLNTTWEKPLDDTYNLILINDEEENATVNYSYKLVSERRESSSFDIEPVQAIVGTVGVIGAVAVGYAIYLKNKNSN